MCHKTVLIVEDDASTREIFATVLRHRGHRVVTARDGREGIDVARAERPDAIILDIMLPRADGWAVTEVLKRDRRTRHVPLVLASVRDAPAGDVDGLWDEYLQKPCDPVDMAKTVERLLRGPEA